MAKYSEQHLRDHSSDVGPRASTSHGEVHHSLQIVVNNFFVVNGQPGDQAGQDGH